MILKPTTLKSANEFLKKYHRHSAPVTGGRFAIMAELNGKIIGVGIAGRPISRHLDNGLTAEITRVCTDGTPNANSFIYGRMKRILQSMGYKKIITYTLASESGASLRAINAKIERTTKAEEWDRKARRRNSQAIYSEPKYRWAI